MPGATTPNEFTPRDARTKDGRAFVIRRVTEPDIPSLYACERALLEAGEGQVRTIDEMKDTAEEFAEGLRSWVEGAHAGYKGLQLVAVCGGRVIGEGRLRRYALKRIRHNGTLSLGVHPLFQGQGVGRAIMESMIGWARERSFVNPSTRAGGVTRLELCVFADNHRAIKLYESLSFTRIGVRHGYIRKDDGSVLDDYAMELLL
jgi:ribosomal protein S18 acetylase RimI-like enzyme